MYTCLAGKPPFTGVSSVNLLMAHLHSVVPPIGERAQLKGAPTLDWAVMTCLEKEPDARFANVDELSRALRIAAAELRGEKPTRPSLVNGRLSVPEEPTPSSSLRIAQPVGAKVGPQPGGSARRDEASGSRSTTGRPKRSRAFPIWAMLAIAVAGLALVAFIVLAAGGVYFGGVSGAPLPVEPTPVSVKEPAPAQPAPLPGAQPAAAPPAKPTAPTVTAPPPARATTPKPAPAATPKAAPPPPAPAPPAPEPHSDLKNPWN
jgi:serine/threonine-protein kinase